MPGDVKAEDAGRKQREIPKDEHRCKGTVSSRYHVAQAVDGGEAGGEVENRCKFHRAAGSEYCQKHQKLLQELAAKATAPREPGSPSAAQSHGNQGPEEVGASEAGSSSAGLAAGAPASDVKEMKIAVMDIKVQLQAVRSLIENMTPPPKKRLHIDCDFAGNPLPSEEKKRERSAWMQSALQRGAWPEVMWEDTEEDAAASEGRANAKAEAPPAAPAREATNARSSAVAAPVPALHKAKAAVTPPATKAAAKTKATAKAGTRL